MRNLLTILLIFVSLDTFGQFGLGAGSLAVPGQNESDPPFDFTPPELVEIRTDPADNSIVELVYNERLYAGSEPATDDFTIGQQSGSLTISSVSITGSVCALQLSGSLAANGYITLSYAQDADPIQDLSKNDAPNFGESFVFNSDATYVLVEEFDNWTGNANPNDFPVGWVLSGPPTATAFWDETAADGSAGTGYALHNTDGTNTRITKNSILDGSSSTYWVAVDIAGGTDIDVRANLQPSSTNIQDYTTTGLKIFSFNCGTDTGFQWKRIGGTAHNTLAYTYIWEN